MRLSALKLRAASLASIAGILLVACASSSGQSTSLASDQTLRLAILGDFGNLDPNAADQETDIEITQNVFDGVVKLDQNLNIVPDLATALPDISSDKLTYTFHLRNDVTFSNGDKFTSKDVLYSWNRAAQIASQTTYGIAFSNIKGFADVSKKNATVKTMTGLTAPDDTTVVVNLTKPASWFLSALSVSGTAGSIVDQKVVDADTSTGQTQWWTKPETLVGTGPFKLGARTAGQSWDFVPVDPYWGSPKPTLKKIHADILQNQSTAISKYEQGGSDIVGYGGWETISPDDLLRIKNDPNESKQLLLNAGGRTYWVTPNLSAIDPASGAARPGGGPFLDNGPTQTSGTAHDLRLAFDLGFDKDLLVKTVCKSLACSTMTGGLIASGLKAYLGDNADPLAKFDATRAKQLLQSADPTGSKTKGLVYSYDPENPLNKPVAENLADQWNTNLGVKVDIQPVTHKDFIKGRQGGKYPLSRDGWSADYDNPQDWFSNLYVSDAGGSSSGYHTAAFDALIDKANQEDLSAAIPDYQAASRLLIDAVAYFPLYQTLRAYIIKPYVKGAGSNALYDYYWANIQMLQH